ncbi:hypothetical protein C1J03_18775 [Sulfitobacter sp. SK012]|nr:hypothetical protein C1J03_18775 [Sulfitobacter sp. SK012]
MALPAPFPAAVAAVAASVSNLGNAQAISQLPEKLTSLTKISVLTLINSTLWGKNSAGVI